VESRERFGTEFEPFQFTLLERGFMARVGTDGT
jgi:hypothetical protein